MNSLKDKVRNLVRRTGFDIIRADEVPVGRSPYRDARVIFGDDTPLVVFDVGANIGDVTQDYLQSGPIERIYCFEPAPKAFAQLSRRYANHPKVELVNCGMGATRGELELSDFGGQGC